MIERSEDCIYVYYKTPLAQRDELLSPCMGQLLLSKALILADRLPSPHMFIDTSIYDTYVKDCRVFNLREFFRMAAA